MEFAFEFDAARSKRVDEDEHDDAPTQENMRGARRLLSNPSTDQKKVRRSQTRKHAEFEDPVDQAIYDWLSGRTAAMDDQKINECRRCGDNLPAGAGGTAKCPSCGLEVSWQNKHAASEYEAINAIASRAQQVLDQEGTL